MPSFTPLHRDLTFLAPLSEARATRLVAFLAEEPPSTVLDVGCGWAELLLRVEELDSGHDPEGAAPFSKVSRMVRDA